MTGAARRREPGAEQRAQRASARPRAARASAARALGRRRELADELARAVAERELDALAGAEEVRDDRERRALHALEEQRGAVRGDHAAMDLGGLEVGIDLGLDRREIAAGLEAAR